MKKEKYFQLLERNSPQPSIGVVKSIGSIMNAITLPHIKRALESHFDEEIKNISISEMDSYGNYTISFDFKNNERKRERIDAIETWLYF